MAHYKPSVPQVRPIQWWNLKQFVLHSYLYVQAWNSPLIYIILCFVALLWMLMPVKNPYVIAKTIVHDPLWCKFVPWTFDNNGYFKDNVVKSISTHHCSIRLVSSFYQTILRLCSESAAYNLIWEYKNATKKEKFCNKISVSAPQLPLLAAIDT